MVRQIILTSLLSLSTQAFTLNNNVAASFDKDEVSLNVASHTCNNIGITNDELLSIAEEAGELYWNRVHTSSLKLVRGSLVNVSTEFRTGKACSNAPASSCSINSNLIVSSDILISCNIESTNYSNNPASVVGVTIPNNVSGTNINGALILVNDISSNSFRDLSRAEKIAVIAHEIGHAIGLGHSQLDSNLMYFQSISTRETLGHDDVDGVTYLYPVEQPFGGCGTVEFVDGTPSGPKRNSLFLVALLMTLLIGYGIKKSTFQKNAP